MNSQSSPEAFRRVLAIQELATKHDLDVVSTYDGLEESTIEIREGPAGAVRFILTGPGALDGIWIWMCGYDAHAQDFMQGRGHA